MPGAYADFAPLGPRRADGDQRAAVPATLHEPGPALRARAACAFSSMVAVYIDDTGTDDFVLRNLCF